MSISLLILSYNTFQNYLSHFNPQQFNNYNQSKMSRKAEKKTCYYVVLGLEKKASLDQIKKAYKKLAMKWHPDKNPNDPENAKEKFRQVSEAYEVLSDPEKKMNYDTYGFEGPQMGGFSDFNFTDADSLFERFFRSATFDNQDDEDFFSTFLGRRGKNGKKGGFGFSSMFDEPFFSSGFGNMGGMGFGSKFSFDDMPPMMKGGFSKSVSTTTKTINGKTVTTKKTTIIKQDGTQQITQQTINGNEKLKKTYSLGPGQNYGGERKAVKHK